MTAYLEIIDRLHGPSVDLELILPKPPLQQLLMGELEGHFLVSSHSDRGRKLLEGSPNRTAGKIIHYGNIVENN